MIVTARNGRIGKKKRMFDRQSHFSFLSGSKGLKIDGEISLARLANGGGASGGVPWENGGDAGASGAEEVAA